MVSEDPGSGEIFCETRDVDEDASENVQDHMTDHQYVSFVVGQEYERKEMDVFDYIGYEIRNIEEREQEMMVKAEVVAEHEEDVLTMHEDMIEEEENGEEFYMESGEKKGFGEILNIRFVLSIFYFLAEIIEETIVIERVEELQEESAAVVQDDDDDDDDNYDEEKAETDDEDVQDRSHEPETFDDCEEMTNYVNIINGSFHCKLCPKIYQKKNITVKHLKTEHKILLLSYNYDNSNRYRKPQKQLEWKCKFCPKRYTSKKLTERHEKLHGPNGDLIYKCSCCVQYFREFFEMEEHQNALHEDRLKCSVDNCGKQFDHPEKLVSHTKYAHKARTTLMKKYLFMCQLCGELKFLAFFIKTFS